MEDGYLQLGSVRGVPIRLHWSTAVGALFFSRFKFAPAFWLGFVLLVLVHEIDHAWVAQRLGHQALAIEVTGFGGLCKWDARRASGLHRSLVAWGGVFFFRLSCWSSLTATKYWPGRLRHCTKLNSCRCSRTPTCS